MWKTRKENREENHLYATRPHDVKLLYKYEPSIIEGRIWECACGHGHIINTLTELGAKNVFGSDFVDYGFGYQTIDFLYDDKTMDNMNLIGTFDTIMTNPPYKHATEFIIRALKFVKPGGRVIMLLPMTILSGIIRYRKVYRRNPPRYIYAFARNTYGILANKGEDEFQTPHMSHCWVIWEKGYVGNTIFKWLADDEDNLDYKPSVRRLKGVVRPRPKDSNGDELPPGVRKRGSTWEVRIKVDGKYIHIGRYANEEDAIKARKDAEIKYRKE